MCTKNIAEFFENTEVLFLPHNITWLLQALDHAIVVASKVTYAAHIPDCEAAGCKEKPSSIHFSKSFSIKNTIYVIA